MNIKKSLILAGLLSAAMTTSYSTFADEMAVPADAAAPAAAAPAAEAPPYTLTFNAGLYSNYMFRGVDYTGHPAVQGGIDFAHSTGFYLGTWWSNLDPYSYGKNAAGTTAGNHLETDWYGGFAKTFDNGFGINLLGNYYFYPEGRKLAAADGSQQRYDSFEASIALSYKWFTYTYFRVLTDYYGSKTNTGGDTDGADYHEFKVNAPLPFGGLNGMAKVGYQSTGDLGGGFDGSEGDYAIGINKDFAIPGMGGSSVEGFNAGLTYTNTFSVKNEGYFVSASGRDLNKEKVWFYLKRTW